MAEQSLEKLFFGLKDALNAQPQSLIVDFLAARKTVRGVYVLWSPDVCPLYVGWSKDVRSRIRQHVSGGALSRFIAQERQVVFSKELGREIRGSHYVSCFAVSATFGTDLERFVQLVLSPRFGMTEDDRRKSARRWRASRVRMALGVLETAVTEMEASESR